jgi:hypothetical protein
MTMIPKVPLSGRNIGLRVGGKSYRGDIRVLGVRFRVSGLKSSVELKQELSSDRICDTVLTSSRKEECYDDENM